MYAEPGKGAIHGAKDLRHGDVYLRLGLGNSSHATSIASTVQATDVNGLAYFTGGTSTIRGKNASNCRAYVN